MTHHPLTITISSADRMALRMLANDLGCTLEEAGARALRDHLIGLGLLELPHELDEDTETAGEA